MRYLVTARVKPGREAELLKAIEDGTLGAGSVAGDEYLRNMEQARLCDNGALRWEQYTPPFESIPLPPGLDPPAKYASCSGVFRRETR